VDSGALRSSAPSAAGHSLSGSALSGCGMLQTRSGRLSEIRTIHGGKPFYRSINLASLRRRHFGDLRTGPWLGLGLSQPGTASMRMASGTLEDHPLRCHFRLADELV